MENKYSRIFRRNPPRGGADAITGFKDPNKLLKLKEEPTKYFTPDIEDIRVGYECETRVGPYPYWVKTKVEMASDFEYIIDKDWEVRVPYLSKEQIEAEGWEEKGSNMWKNGYWLMAGIVKDDSGIKSRSIHITDYNGDTYFLGECKDINTFRYICKLLHI